MIQEYFIGQQVPNVFAPLIPFRYVREIEQGELMAKCSGTFFVIADNPDLSEHW